MHVPIRLDTIKFILSGFLLCFTTVWFSIAIKRILTRAPSSKGENVLLLVIVGLYLFTFAVCVLGIVLHLVGAIDLGG